MRRIMFAAAFGGFGHGQGGGDRRGNCAGRLTPEDVRGLQSFIEKPVYRAPFGLLATRDDQWATDDPRIISLLLSTLLFMR